MLYGAVNSRAETIRIKSVYFKNKISISSSVQRPIWPNDALPDLCVFIHIYLYNAYDTVFIVLRRKSELIQAPCGIVFCL